MTEPPLRFSVVPVIAPASAEARKTAAPAAVHSALLRARAQIARIAPVVDNVAEPTEPNRRATLDRYVAAFINADTAALVRLLRADIVVEMPPQPSWLRGRGAVAQFFAGHVLTTPGAFRMAPTTANGQAAFVAYQRTQDGSHRPHAVHVLTLDTAGIAHIAVFREPAVCELFTRS
jgi:RNA polymerase sigma-70 factor, ECF subfamily